MNTQTLSLGDAFAILKKYNPVVNDYGSYQNIISKISTTDTIVTTVTELCFLWRCDTTTAGDIINDLVSRGAIRCRRCQMFLFITFRQRQGIQPQSLFATSVIKHSHPKQPKELGRQIMHITDETQKSHGQALSILRNKGKPSGNIKILRNSHSISF